jgi:formylglycine-generating enzyme required for sulfatase activity
LRNFFPLIIFLSCFLGSIKVANSQPTPPGMVLVPSGAYEMGDLKSLSEVNVLDILNPDRHALGPENPSHRVFVDAFFIDMYEVSNLSFAEFIKAKNRKTPTFWKNSDFNQPKQPVVGVSWKEAKAFCEWKNKRLPTEAEWEKASKGQQTYDFPWGNSEPTPDKLNFDNKVGKTTPVGSYNAGKSSLGVYDLSGNVSEWVNDWYGPEYYLFSPEKNPQGPPDGQYKIIRGGNWRNKKDDVKITFRNATTPKLKSKTVGFRCAKNGS